jgi:hypothetical protein
MGIDLVGLREMARDAGADPPFLVIQATGKKRFFRFTGIQLPENETPRIGTGARPRIAVHHCADVPTFRA